MKRVIVTIALAILANSTAFADDLPLATSIAKKHSFGVGFGIPYGVLGTNFDAGLTPNLSLSFGFGTTVFAGMGYNFGMKFFFLPPDRTFRPRISAYYGVNSMFAVESSGRFGGDIDGKSYTGLTLGIGSQWMWGKSKSNGLDLDIMFIASTGMDVDELRESGYDVNEPGRVKISIGYRHGL